MKKQSEASSKWKKVKGKPDKINELILKTKADLKQKEAKGLQRWLKFMVTRPKKSTGSTTSTMLPPRLQPPPMVSSILSSSVSSNH